MEHTKEILKSMSMEILSDNKQFIYCCFNDLKIGDIVSSITFTNSQKWLSREGYDEYNMEKQGIMMQINTIPEKSIIKRYDKYKNIFYDDIFYCDPGTSGGVIFKKYIAQIN
jgi:hypothetical protein